LAEGPRRALELFSAADELGISIASLRRAKEQLGLRARKIFMGWAWYPPEPAPADGEGEGTGAGKEYSGPVTNASGDSC